MKDKPLTAFSRRQISLIHAKSRKYNLRRGEKHAVKLIELIKKHAGEIDDLRRKRDRHYVVETGDLAVLCFELIKEAKSCPDKILAQCYRRYHKKLDDFLGPARR